SHLPEDLPPITPTSPQETVNSKGKERQTPLQQEQASSTRLFRAIPPTSILTFTQQPPKRKSNHRHSASEPGSLPSSTLKDLETESRHLRDRSIPISLEKPPAARSPAVPALN